MTAVRPPTDPAPDDPAPTDPARPAGPAPVAEPPWWARALLDALAAGRLPPALARAVHGRTTGPDADPRWRAWYHGLRAVERAAAGGPALSAGQRDTLRALVLGDVPTALPAAVKAPPARRSSLAFVAAGLAVCSAVLFVVVRPGPAGEVWSARGAGATVGVRARCVDPSTKTVRAEAEGGTTPAVKGSRLQCAPGDVVVLEATNLGEAERFVTIVVVGDDGAELVGPADGIAVGRGQVAAPLPHGVSLGDPGRRTLFALFWPRPPGDAARAVVDDLRRHGLDAGARALPRLPGGASEQARIDIDVTSSSREGAAP